MANVRYISSAVEISQQRLELFKWKEKHAKENDSDGEKTSVQRKNENIQHGPSFTREEPLRVNSLLDMLIYIFYLPLFFTGPILTFDHFYKQVSLIRFYLLIILLNESF